MDMTSRPPPDPDPWSTHRHATTETEHGFLLNACLHSPPAPDQHKLPTYHELLASVIYSTELIV
eukprot:1823730-Ditylum_brightwellii.AAC.1